MHLHICPQMGSIEERSSELCGQGIVPQTRREPVTFIAIYIYTFFRKNVISVFLEMDINPEGVEYHQRSSPVCLPSFKTIEDMTLNEMAY